MNSQSFLIYEFFKFLHGIGLLMTVGMITASIVYGWILKLYPNFKLKFPYKLISPSVKLGLFILIVSGLAMYSMRAKVLNGSIVFWIKMVFVLSVVGNNVWINSFLRPKSRKLSADPAMAESPELARLKRRFKMAENISLFLWYAATIISMALPEGHEGRGEKIINQGVNEGF